MFDENRYINKQERKKPKYSPKEGTELLKKSKLFIDYFNSNSEKILKLIANKSGFYWKEDKIIVYISDTVPNSYEDPLTLKYQENRECMHLVLIHELIHRNVPENLQNSVTDKERETWVEVISKEIYDILNINCPEYPGLDIRNVNKFDKPKEQSLKEYLYKTMN